jgi:putative tryptophan/tyrosine transport system substrate-binding protein
MRRREFIAGFAASTAWPFAARAQQAGKAYRVGLLATRVVPESEERRNAMAQVLAAHGFVADRNLQFEPRWGDG